MFIFVSQELSNLAMHGEKISGIFINSKFGGGPGGGMGKK